MIDIEKIKLIYDEFLKSYDEESKSKIWNEQSKKFKDFWYNKIVPGKSENLNDEELDEIIKILDRNGKGNTKNSESIARLMIPQNAWRRMFHDISKNKNIANCITKIFEENYDNKIKYINELYSINKEKNHLTGQSGNAINAMLAAYDPFNNLSIVSLNDRLTLIEFMQFPIPNNIKDLSMGEKFVISHKIISEGFKSLGFSNNMLTITRFCYYHNMKSLWKLENIIKRHDNRSIEVTIPTDFEDDNLLQEEEKEDPRESIQIQAILAEIGSRMNMKIWIPKADRSRVMKLLKNSETTLLDTLPLNYDDITLKTIEQIDVLWIRGRSIIRAFEVEHTTSVYSGILRMADLLALQPNMDIKIHIVAPSSKRGKVFQEIRRPVFSLLERGPLSEICTYISYENIYELSKEKHLEHLSDRVLDDYAESAE